MKSLLNDCLITRVMNEVAAGQTEQTSTILDMSGYDSVMFILVCGTVTDASVITLTPKENTTSSTSGATAVAGTAPTITAATSSDAILIVDVIRPSKRYVYADVTRTTQNCAISAVIAIQYNSHSLPVATPANSATFASALLGPEV